MESGPTTKSTQTSSTTMTARPPNAVIEPGNLVVVDLGKKKRRQIRNLRRGRGRLMDRVSEVANDLRTEGALSTDGTSIVVVVVERKRNKKKKYGMWY